MAFANDDMQTWLLPQLLTQSTDATKALFDKQLVLIIHQLNPSDINSLVKPLLKEYISSSTLSSEDTNYCIKAIE